MRMFHLIALDTKASKANTKDKRTQLYLAFRKSSFIFSRSIPLKAKYNSKTPILRNTQNLSIFNRVDFKVEFILFC